MFNLANIQNMKLYYWRLNKLKNFLLGKVGNEEINLRSASWDCSWYVGFGYIGNNHYHSHLDYFLDQNCPNKDRHTQLKTVFGETLNAKLKDDSTLWKFAELFQSWVILKDSYEFYHSGGAHLTTNPVNDLKSYTVAIHVLEDIFKVINAISDITGLDKILFDNNIKRDVYKSINPTTFRKNPKYTYQDRHTIPEWILVYLNKYDRPENHKGKLIPKSVISKWKKDVKRDQDEINNSRFTDLFKEV